MDTDFAKPYYCVMVNMLSHIDRGLVVCRSYNRLRDVLVSNRFLVKKIHPVWRQRNFTGKLLIEFGMSTAHRESALKLECLFRFQGRNKEFWVPPFENRTCLIFGSRKGTMETVSCSKWTMKQSMMMW
ncbi:hypothetical protein RND81_05G070900 [Saponaria officinalis]|uniref:XS domain-containing protein n=1 Tax=Saponaria officinalis TaxID=3572 RepID=A0AAW1KVP5_SAPOF